MSRVIDAIFEKGVFKPLQKVDIKEHKKVAIKVLDTDEWQMRFDKIIRKIQKRAAAYSAKEIEEDIKQAIMESREPKRARKSGH